MNQMSKCYIYRYVEEQTKEIVYIGKTGRLSVEDRINQHKFDNIGNWCKTHKYYIEFLELPKEEDMNYIESYLIRKYTPECNIIFSDGSKLPPFDIIIDESLWKSYDTYMKERKEYSEKMMKIAQENIASNVSAIMKANAEFDNKLEQTIKNMHDKDKQFVKFLLSYNKTNSKIPQLSFNYFLLFYKIDNTNINAVNQIINRLKNVCFDSKMKGMVNQTSHICLFDDIYIKEDIIFFIFGENYKYILEKIV